MGISVLPALSRKYGVVLKDLQATAIICLEMPIIPQIHATYNHFQKCWELGQMPQIHISYPNVIPPCPLFHVGLY